MIISRAPYRVSFFGGGTDFKEWYSEHGSSIISTSIDKYCSVIGRKLPKFFDFENRVVWSKIEQVSDVNEIAHPTLKAALNYYNKSGFEFIHTGDMPARSGLGSSSSFSVALLNLLAALDGNKKSATELANQAIFLERQLMSEPGGIQDQIAASYGGLNKISIGKDGTFIVKPVQITSKNLKIFNNSLMLFFTGITRSSMHLSSQQRENINSNEKILEETEKLTRTAIDAFENNFSIEKIGELLCHGWELKCASNKNITSSFLNEIYSKAMIGGALGGKLLGSGGGGFFVFVVPEDKKQKVRCALSELLEISFNISSLGAHIVETRKEI